MGRRKGQNPEVRVGERADGQEYYFFQYWIDVPGQEERRRQTEVIGLVSQMTRSEAERKKLDFISRLQLNSNDYRIPSSHNFADAVKHYRNVFAPRMLRDSTLSLWDGRLKTHLEADWNDVPIEHITIDSVNEWAWKKRSGGLSLGDDQGCAADHAARPVFILKRQKASLSWAQAEQIAERVRNMDGLGDARREQYSPLILLAAASGLRSSELLVLKINDIDFKASTVRVDESSGQRTNGNIGPCKNAAAYRTVVLHDPEGKKSMRKLRHLLRGSPNAEALVFRSQRGGLLLETTILNQGLYPALKALGLPEGGLHGFRRGCNRRSELARINPAVIRQQMGHSSHRMTALYSGEIPQVSAAFSGKLLEKMENEAAA